MGVEWGGKHRPPDVPGWSLIAARPKLTAAGLRALGRPVPASVADEECVVLVEVDR